MAGEDDRDTLHDLGDLLAASSAAPPPRTARRAGKVIAVVTLTLVGAIVLAGGGYVAWALNAPVPDPVVSIAAPAAPTGAPAAFAPPGQGASALRVTGGEEYLGAGAADLLAGHEVDTSYPLASITKLVTALVILEQYPVTPTDPGPMITFSEADHDLYDEYFVQGATIAPMPAGSSMPLRDALALMLVPSASNYADALARWAYGSHGAFRDAAGGWLDAQGLAATTIAEPTGLSAENRSTVRDLLKLGAIAAAHPVIANIAAMPAVKFPGGGAGYNTNTLLGVDGITGLKTGNLGAGAFALLYVADVPTAISDEPYQVIGAILGGAGRESVNATAQAQLAALREGVHAVSLIDGGNRVGTCETVWGAEVPVVAAADASVTTWSDTAITVELSEQASAQHADGDVVGTLSWVAGPQSARADLIIDGTLEQPSAWWRLTHPELLG